jgi:hypothetical protein
MAGEKSDDELRRERAARLRERIDELQSPADDPGPPEQQPGESDLAYIERRSREIDSKKRPR